jgi:hypothetical protein
LFQYVLSSLVAGAVVVWFSVAGYGISVLLGLVPVAYSLRLAGLLRIARTSADFLGALQGAGLVVAAYGALFGLGLVFSTGF